MFATTILQTAVVGGVGLTSTDDCYSEHKIRRPLYVGATGASHIFAT